jgi:hypothetical protein
MDKVVGDFNAIQCRCERIRIKDITGYDFSCPGNTSAQGIRSP